MIKRSLLIISVLLLIVGCTNNNHSVETGPFDDNSAIVYESDGKTPCAGAIVRVFKENSDDGQYVAVFTTDANGRYLLKGLPTGTYNICVEKDTFVAFQESVFISEEKVPVTQDTLESPSSLRGFAGIQPQHDPRTVTIQVIGTDKKIDNVDVNGEFFMEGLAAGKYTLLLRSTLPGYTPTTCKVTVAPSAVDTLDDTVWLIYTGIPLVIGVVSSYDTLNGIVTLQWNKTKAFNFLEYVVFRDNSGSATFSSVPIATVADTLYRDTIFKKEMPTGEFSMNDPNDYQYKYRIAVRDKSGKDGETYGYCGVTAASLTKVKTLFTSSVYLILKDSVSDVASINDSMRFIVHVANPTRNYRAIAWNDLGSGNSIRTHRLDSSANTAFDTCRYSWNTTGIKGIVCTVEDMAGTIWNDTLSVSIVADTPIVKLNDSFLIVRMMDTIGLLVSVSDQFGYIKNIEWDIGKTGTFTVSEGLGLGKKIVVPNKLMEYFICIVRVTDDDGYSSIDSVRIKIMGIMTDVDGNVYNTVKIGTQEWMAENLRTTKFNNGTPITYQGALTNWSEVNTPVYSYHPFDTSVDSIEKWGLFYNWYAVNPANPNKIAPYGWHVPDTADWNILENYLAKNGYNYDGNKTEGFIAKSLTTTDNWSGGGTALWAPAVNPELNNTSGFSALPSGFRDDGCYRDKSQMTHSNRGVYGYWLSSSLHNSLSAVCRGLYTYGPTLLVRNIGMDFGCSVRLVRD